MEVVVGLASNEREADRKRERGREKEEINNKKINREIIYTIIT